MEHFVLGVFIYLFLRGHIVKEWNLLGFRGIFKISDLGSRFPMKLLCM